MNFEFPKKILGEILIQRHRITKDQLSQALAIQNKEGGVIGEVLINLGFVEEQDIVVALVVQCNIPYISLDKYEIEPGVASLIPRETAMKYLYPQPLKPSVIDKVVGISIEVAGADAAEAAAKKKARAMDEVWMSSLEGSVFSYFTMPNHEKEFLTEGYRNILQKVKEKYMPYYETE